MTRIHIVSLPHTLITEDYAWCAYTLKVKRFTKMLHLAGVDALVYGPDIHDTPTAVDYVTIVEESDRVEWFGGPEWDSTKVFDRWQEDDIAWVTTNERAAAAIRERWQPGDMLGLIGGRCQELIVTLLADLGPLTVEWGIGYSGILNHSHKVYESYAWMHHVAGYYRDDDIKFFDTVIPNCFDSNDFTPSVGAGGYLLYMGRPNPRKGLPIIEELAKRVDVSILIAGQPGPDIPGTTYVGLVTGARKQELLAGARALLTPTTYLEPFGGVAVEAMLSGTPVIATDYGAFTETVVPGVTGFRCRMLREFMDAVDAVQDLDRRLVLQHATDRYTLPVGSHLYGDYLRRVESLYRDGWYTGVDEFRSV